MMERKNVKLPHEAAEKNRKKSYAIGAIFTCFIFIALIFLSVGCSSNHLVIGDNDQGLSQGENNKKNETDEERLERFASEAEEVGANELGKVPIFVYHKIGKEEGRWTRTPEKFRKDLEELHDRDYVLVPLAEYLDGNIDVPEGKSPAVITFDDSTAGHFRLLPYKEGRDENLRRVEVENNDGKKESYAVDPDSAVGVLLEFAEDNPGFGHCATFHVNNRPFSGERGQDMWKEKLRMLDEWGFEIGNHTLNHSYLKALSSDEITRQITKMQEQIQEAVPEYEPNTFAIVQDGRPENESLLKSGQYEDTNYEHKGILLWAWRAENSLFHRDFDPMGIQRIQVFEDEGGSTLSMWLDRLSENRFISDGKPETVAFPKEWEDVFAAEKFDDKEIITYETETPGDVPETDEQAQNAKGLHVTFSYASSGERWNSIINLTEETGLNAIQLDVKDESGRVGYSSEVELARNSGAATGKLEIEEMLTQLRERGIYSVARIVVFRDPVVAQHRPDLMAKTSSGNSIAGGVWVNPYSKEIWDYNVSLAEEAYELGFDEVQFDYVRFPEGSGSRSADYGDTGGVDKIGNIANFLKYARGRIGWEKNLSAAVFGFIGHASDDLNIGQRPEHMAPYLDYMSPMVYPSHYSPGNYGFDNPNAYPYEVVDESMDEFKELVYPSGCRLRPWLQAFTMGPPRYSRNEIRAQIEAVNDNDVDTWLFWNAGVRYNMEDIVP